VDVTGNTRFLPVHFHCISNDYNLPTLFIVISKVLV